MKKGYTVTAIVLAFLLSISLAFAAGGEMAKHPRIRKAIGCIDGAIQEMKAAPHDFGGHREAAVDACQKAREQLKLALDYRAGADSHP